MSNHDETDLLTQVLHDRAAGVGGGSLDLETVRGRARSIRRRRHALAGTAAALVAAVAVPAGLTLVDTDRAADVVPPPVTSPTTDATASPTPSPSESAAPRPGRTELTLQGLEEGAPAGLPYVVVDGSKLVTPDGILDLPEAYSMITPFGDGWIAMALGARPEGGVDVVMLDEAFNETSRKPSVGFGLAPNEARTRVAYTVVSADGQPMLADAAVDGQSTTSWALPDEEIVEPVGYLGDGDVVFRTEGDRFETFLAEEGQDPVKLEGFLRVEAVSDANGLLAGMLSYDDETGQGCWVVTDPRSGGEPLWQTCTYEPADFSPDGRYVLAYPSDSDGVGPSGMYVLDARTGSLVTGFSPPRGSRTSVVVWQAAWEDADSVLALVEEDGRMRIVRAELDGSLETASGVFEVTDLSFPLWFADTRRS